ncbi:MAG: hypothetical protein Q8O00_16015, partial [Holophaga sp.]|nr:hypothetical protein [Holophaga sp.]
GSVQLQSLLMQRKGEDAIALLASLRVQAGKGWPQVAARLREAIGEISQQSDDKEIKDDHRLVPKKLEESLRQAFREPPAPDPLPPESGLLRLALLEGNTDRLAWGKLQIHPALVPWDASELSWQPLSKAEAARLREQKDWPQGQRWVLMQRDHVLASGPGLPTAAIMEAALRGQGTPQLDALDAFIKTHPQRLDGRRARLESIRLRLPNPHLERRFLEDLVVSGEPLGALPFEPNPEIWVPAAKRVCQQTSEQLRNWPFGTTAWASYASWSSLDARIPRPAALLATLDTWPRQVGVRLPGPIPSAASAAVMRVLREQRRYEELGAWVEVLWERGLKEWLVQWASLPSPRKLGQFSSLDSAAPHVKRLLAAWGEALTKQGQKARLASLRTELDALRPGLSALLSVPVEN